MYPVKLVYLPQWDLEFFRNLACQEFPINMHDLCRILLLLHLQIGDARGVSESEETQ